MYIMCLIIFGEKAEVQDQYPLSLNSVQKVNDPLQDRNKSIGPFTLVSRISVQARISVQGGILTKIK